MEGVRLLQSSLARLFPAGTSPLFGEILAWDGPATAPPAVIISFWPAGADVPPSGPIAGGDGWHFEFPAEAWAAVLGLFHGPHGVALVTAGGTPHLAAGPGPIGGRWGAQPLR
jgi:hypothetical protein